MQQAILEEIKEKALPILKQADVKKAAIFGSYVRGDQTQDSDIDMLVELPHNATLIDLVGLKYDLEDVLKKKVDVVEYVGIKPRIKDAILASQFSIL